MFVGIGSVRGTGLSELISKPLDADLNGVEVHGFPAVRLLPTRSVKYCSVIIEVGPAALVDVQFSDGGRPPPIPQNQLCRDAEQVAGIAIGNLLSG